MLQPSYTRCETHSVNVLIETRHSCVSTQTPYLILDGRVLNEILFVSSYIVNTKYVVFTKGAFTNCGPDRNTFTRERLVETQFRCFVCVELDAFVSTRVRHSMRMSQSMPISHVTLRNHLLSYTARLPSSICFLFFHLEQRRFMSVYTKSEQSSVYLPLFYHTKHSGSVSQWI